MKKVYLAARYSRHPEMQERARDLQSLGYRVTSRWIWGEHKAWDDDLIDNAEHCVMISRDDLEDIAIAEQIICFTEEPRVPHTRGGRHFEAGYAHALGHKMVVVGPRENTFYSLADEHYATWEEFIGKNVQRDTSGSAGAARQEER